MSEKEYKGGSLQSDYSQWVEDLRKINQTLLKSATQKWYKVGAAHLARTKMNTPVGQYSNEVSFYTKDGTHVHFFIKRVPQGGQLRLRWQQTPVRLENNILTTVVFNNVEYAPFVEYGHRIRNKAGQTIGWVPGRYMMTESLKIADDEDIPRSIAEILADIRREYQ